jgi:tellurite resistance protein TehA-like permease
MDSEKDLLLYYQTSLRNVGLFTSVSLALLAVSRYYRGKTILFNTAYIFFSLLFLIAAMLICYFLIQTIEYEKMQIDDLNHIERMEIVPKLTLGIDGTISIFILFTLIKQFTTGKITD